MNQRQLNKKLQHQVRNYYEYLHKEESLDEEDASQMINNLPSSMRESITFDMNHKLLYEQKIFSLNFSKEFLNKLSLCMKQVKIGPEIQLFNQNDVDQRIYFILKGSVDMYINMNNINKSFKILKKGDLVGETEFFSSSYRRFSAKTLNVVKLMVIEFSDFNKCIKNFTEDYEKFNEIKDKVSMYKDMTKLDRRCQSCGKFTHQFTNCPQLVFVANADKAIYQYNHYEAQQREKLQRNFRKKQNSLNYSKKGQIAASKYQILNNIKPVNPSEEHLYDSEESHIEYIQQQTEGAALNQQMEESESSMPPARKKAYTSMEIDIKRIHERKNTKKSTFHKEVQDFKSAFEKAISIDEKLVDMSPNRGRKISLMASEYSDRDGHRGKDQYPQQSMNGTQLLIPQNGQIAQMPTAISSQTFIQRQGSLGQNQNYIPMQHNPGSINLDIPPPILVKPGAFQLQNFTNSLTYLPNQHELNYKYENVNQDSAINNSRYDKQPTNMSSKSHFQNNGYQGYQFGGQSFHQLPNENNNIYRQKQLQFYSLLNFDILKNFKSYFPHNNFVKIMKSLMKLRTRQESNGRVLNRIKKKIVIQQQERKGGRAVTAKQNRKKI